MKTGLLIEPKSVSSIVDAVSFAMDNPELEREIVKNGIDWSSENTWNKSAETLNSAYISVISE